MTQLNPIEVAEDVHGSYQTKLMRPLSSLFIATLFFILLPLAGKSQITRADAKVAMQCYNNTFYNQYGTYGSSYKAMYYANTYRNSRADFWREVESIETLIDAYTINNDADFQNKIRYLYNGIRDGYGLNWSSNPFNDDVIWGSLMCIRAYFIFNDGGMKDMAVNNFNVVWNRAWDNNLGGGLWWKTDKASKNACVNAPAAICAMYLYYATGDVTYRNKAKQIMDWMKSRLYVGSSGEVKGAINASGVITEGSRTYTQGAFIGAAGELQKYFPADNWRDIGIRAMDYTKTVLSNSAGLLPDEYCGGDDCPGFKGIFARWACKFVKDYNLSSYYTSWLNYNARQAWTYRNSSGMMWAQWWRRTPDAFLTSWETTSGVSMMNNVFLYSGTTAREAFELVEDDNVMSVTNESEGLHVYPVPAGETLTLDGDATSNVEMRIINSQGRTVLTKKINNKELDIADLPKGVYTIMIRQNGKQVQKRFVKN
jgi:predicted alpha-1,6-mannanase (GH76 family)